MLEVLAIVNSPVTSDCYVLFDKCYGTDCIIVDPGSRDNQELFTLIDGEGLSPKYIILTHEHFDHCWGVNQFVEKYHIPIICSQLCAEAIKSEKRNCSVFYDNREPFIIDSQTISTESLGSMFMFGMYEIRFYNTPGHTDASISFVIEDYLFTGDTLIKDEKTVTKLPTGSAVKLNESLILFASMCGKHYTIYPGHGKAFPLDGYDLSISGKGIKNG